MAREVRIFHVTIPAGTAISQSAFTTLTFPPRTVTEVEIIVPPGPRGEVGVALGSSGVKVIPSESGTYIVTDNEHISWPLENFWNSGSWDVFAYNTGNFGHTIEIRFLVSLNSQPAATGAQPLSADQLAAISQQPSGAELPPAAPLPELPQAPSIPVPAIPSLPSTQGSAGAPAQAVFLREEEMRILMWGTEQHFMGVDSKGNLKHWWNDVANNQTRQSNDPGVGGLVPYAPVALEVLPTPGGASGDTQLHFLTASQNGLLVHGWQDRGNRTWNVETL